MIEQQYRPRRRHRLTCAFGYLTVAPIDGHLGPRQAREHALPSDRVSGVDAGREPGRPVPVVRRIVRRVTEAVE
jgi:hypothetical protein